MAVAVGVGVAVGVVVGVGVAVGVGVVVGVVVVVGVAVGVVVGVVVAVGVAVGVVLKCGSHKLIAVRIIGGSRMEDRDAELEYLKYFYQVADFGPADGDVRVSINEMFEEKFGKKVPKGYGMEQ